MRGHRRAHVGEDRGEDTYESTYMRAHRSMHMRFQEQAESIMDMSEEPFLYGNLKENAHRYIRRAIFYGNLQEKGTGTSHRSHSVPSGHHVLEGS